MNDNCDFFYSRFFLHVFYDTFAFIALSCKFSSEACCALSLLSCVAQLVVSILPQIESFIYPLWEKSSTICYSVLWLKCKEKRMSLAAISQFFSSVHYIGKWRQLLPVAFIYSSIHLSSILHGAFLFYDAERKNLNIRQESEKEGTRTQRRVGSK